MLLFGCAATSSGGMMSKEPLNLNSTEQKFIDSKFTIVKSREQIRNDVVQRLSGKNALIANPGEKYNETDLVDMQYPSRMILFAGESGDIAFVHYMQGGFAPHPALYLAEFEGEQIVYECSYLLPKAENIDQLKDFLKTKAKRSKIFE
jgi:hypothetical protein